MSELFLFLFLLLLVPLSGGNAWRASMDLDPTRWLCCCVFLEPGTASVRPMTNVFMAAGSSCGDWPWPVVSLPTDSVVLCRTHPAFGSAHGPRAARFVGLARVGKTEQAHGTLSLSLGRAVVLAAGDGTMGGERRWAGPKQNKM